MTDAELIALQAEYIKLTKKLHGQAASTSGDLEMQITQAACHAASVAIIIEAVLAMRGAAVK